MIKLPISLGLCKQTILIAALCLKYSMEITYTLPSVVEWIHSAHATPGFNYFALVWIFQLSGCSSHCKVWPTETSNHRALQGPQGSTHKCTCQCMVWVRFLWRIHSNTAISLRFRMPSSPLHKTEGNPEFPFHSQWAIFWPMIQLTSPLHCYSPS